MSSNVIPVIVYAESTPNPATMKYVVNKILIENRILEYNSASEAKSSGLAEALFEFPFITGVFITGNFITVTKNNQVEWMDVAMELREFIRGYFSSGKEIIIRAENAALHNSGVIKSTEPDAIAENPKTEIEYRIVELLEEYIRPAVEQDGGAIHFKSFDDGVLKVILRGACSGCPSSSVTLKAGIQGLFQRMLPEVKEVIAEES